MSQELREMVVRRRAARMAPALVYLAVAAVALAVGSTGFLFGYSLLWALVSLALALARGPKLLVGQDDVLVRPRRGADRRFVWSSVLEGSWGAAGFGRAGPVLRLEGRPFDVPGPNSPLLIAAWFMPGAEARQRWADTCTDHGVPFARAGQAITNVARSSAVAPSPGPNSRPPGDPPSP